MFGLGIRDILLILVILGSLPIAVLRPFFGLLVFSWLAYMRPTDMGWGGANAIHPSMLVALATLLGVFLRPEERLAVLEKRTVLLALFVGAVVVSALLAVQPLLAWGAPGETTQLVKVAFIAVLTTGLARTQGRVRALLIVIGGSLGLLALKSFVQGIFNPGQIMHGPGGMILDNNDYGLALVMALPILAYLAREERGLALKLLLGAMAVACVAGVLLTRSRGGAIALAAMVLLWIILSRKSAMALICAPLALALTVFVTPPALFERVRNLTSGTLDASAEHRLVAWGKALGTAAQRPFFGIGPGGFTSNWDNVGPATEYPPVVAHNTYLQLLAESGWVTLILYLLLMGVTLFCLLRLRRRASEPWRSHYATAVFLSLAGFLAGSVFLSRSLYDLPYHLVGISVCLAVASSDGSFNWFGLKKSSGDWTPSNAAERAASAG